MDAFSKCHPAVNFLFFLGAIVCGVVIQHPAYLAAGLLCGGSYYLLLHRPGKLLRLLPVFLLVAAMNPLFNTQGQRVLFQVFGRPYTLEALLYGMALGAMFVTMLLWFGCYNRVLTGDKFTSLFGNLIPALSLVLVMVFRMVPNFIRKTRQITGARRSIGKGGGQSNGEKLAEGLTVLGTLAAWALEGSLVTADSMTARGYGTGRRSSFMIYSMTRRDALLLGTMGLLMAATVTAACLGQMAARFTPTLSIAAPGWGIVPYAAYLLIPTALHMKEAIQWRILKSKI